MTEEKDVVDGEELIEESSKHFPYRLSFYEDALKGMVVVPKDEWNSQEEKLVRIKMLIEHFPKCCLDEKHYCERDAHIEELKAMVNKTVPKDKYVVVERKWLEEQLDLHYGSKDFLGKGNLAIFIGELLGKEGKE